MAIHFFLCAALLFSATNHDEGFQYRFHRFIHDQRLSGENVRSVFQDSYGFVWFSIDSEGLCKYNGTELEVYSHIGRDTTTISSNYINDISEDKHGNIWLATAKGLNIFNRKKGYFQRVDLSEKGFDLCNILAQDENGAMWLGTDNGLLKFSVSEDGSYYPDYTDPITLALNGVSVRSILQDKDRAYWIGTESGLFNFSIPEYRIRHWNDTSGRYTLSDNEINALLQLSQDFFLIGTDNGVNLFNRKKDHFHRLEFRESGAFNEAKVGIVDIYKDSKGVVWIGTSSYGILTGKPSLEGGGTVPFSFSVPDGISGVGSNNITGFCEDASDQLWVTTKFGGISIYDRRKELFPHFSLPHHEGVGHNHIISSIEDRDGILWFGTRNRGLLKYDHNDRSFTEVPIFQGADEVRRIEAIGESEDGYLWFGHKKGINYLDPVTLNQGYYELPKTFSINEDKLSNLWIGTIKGIYFKGKGENSIERFRSRHSLFTNPEVEVDYVYADSHLSVWFGTNHRGLWRYFPEMDSLCQFSHSESLPGSISGNTIRSIFEDSRGSIWIGTKSSGLNLFDSVDHFSHFRRSNGLPSNSVFSIVEDDDGYLWLATNNGVSKFDPDSGKFLNFNKNHGLQGNVFEKRACLKSHSGELLIAGNNGFNLFDPRHVSLENFSPRLVITSLKANGRILGQDIFRQDTFRVPHNENMISFEFSSLDFRDKTALRYAYKLDGVDEEWIFSENQNAVTYSNLAPGKYDFRLRATNADGIWSADEHEITVVVGKPFWLEWWAYMFYLFFIGVILFFIYRIATVRAGYFHKLQTKELELKRTQELHQLKLNFFTNISHELRTPLTLIMASIEKLMQSQRNAPGSKSIKTAHRSAKQLLNLTDQLLYFRRVEQGNLPLKVSRGDLKKYITELVMAFDELALKEDIKLTFSSGELPRETWFDADKLEKVVSNLIVNALKYTQPGGSISLHCTWIDHPEDTLKTPLRKGVDYVKFCIQDSGRGMTEEQLKHIFDRYYQTDIINAGGGIGLDLVNGLVKLLGGQILVESEYGKGSKFIVYLPVSKNAFSMTELKPETTNNKPALSDLLIDVPLFPDLPLRMLEDLSIEPGNKMRHKLLIAEDNQELTTFLIESLRKDFFVNVVRNGREALSQVRDFHPDIILSDIMMPEMNGLELCRHLKQHTETSHIPVVLLTARILEEHQAEGFESGADAYVTKPFNVEVLTLRLKGMLNNRKKVLSKMRGGFTKIQDKLTPRNGGEDQFLHRIDQIIHENYQKVDFSVEEFAYDLHMSRSQLFRKLKMLTGKTPSEYLYAFRIGRAMAMLADGELTIAEISYRTGFRSPNSFTKTFTKHVGVSPRRYVTESDPALLWERK